MRLGYAMAVGGFSGWRAIGRFPRTISLRLRAAAAIGVLTMLQAVEIYLDLVQLSLNTQKLAREVRALGPQIRKSIAWEPISTVCVRMRRLEERMRPQTLVGRILVGPWLRCLAEDRATFEEALESGQAANPASPGSSTGDGADAGRSRQDLV